MNKPKLSGFNYIRNWTGVVTRIGLWKTYAGDDTYDYCTAKDCVNAEEHAYAFDGQFFYKKRVRV